MRSPKPKRPHGVRRDAIARPPAAGSNADPGGPGLRRSLRVPLALGSAPASSSPLSPGLDAYEHGDWEAALNLARERLKDARNDVPALRLLARSSVKLGLDASALSLFQRLGPRSMTADDYYLLGVALKTNRQPSGRRSLGASLAGRPGSPREPRGARAGVLRGGSLRRRRSAGSPPGRQHPRWRVPARRLLGKIDLARNNLADAIDSWRQSLDAESAEDGADASGRDAARKDLARALLRTRQPAEARGHLQHILAKAPDAEASWLMSRAWMQENAIPGALAALKEAGPFAEEDPTRPDPAPFVGSASCAPCHSEKFQAQQNSPPCPDVPSRLRARGARAAPGPHCRPRRFESHPHVPEGRRPPRARDAYARASLQRHRRLRLRLRRPGQDAGRARSLGQCAGVAALDLSREDRAGRLGRDQRAQPPSHDGSGFPGAAPERGCGPPLLLLPRHQPPGRPHGDGSRGGRPCHRLREVPRPGGQSPARRRRPIPRPGDRPPQPGLRGACGEDLCPVPQSPRPRPSSRTTPRRSGSRGRR